MNTLNTDIQRRKFLEQSGRTVLVAGAALCGPTLGAWADDASPPTTTEKPAQPYISNNLITQSTYRSVCGGLNAWLFCQCD